MDASEFLTSETSRNPWYGVRTRPNHEKTAAALLEGKGYPQYLPLYRKKRRWSDRVVETELPLFPGYVFCRFDAKKRLAIVTTPGVISVVGFGKEPAPIDDCEISAVERVLSAGLRAEPCPYVPEMYLKEGERVRVTVGALEGVEGILMKRKNECRVVVSVRMLQRSIAVEMNGEYLCSLAKGRER